MKRLLKLTHKRHRLLAVAIAVIAFLLLATLVFASQVSAPQQIKKASTPKTSQKKTVPAQAPAVQPVPSPVEPAVKTDPTSPSVVINKQRPLNPLSYAPADLVAPNVPLRGNISSDERLMRAEPAAALERLVSAAAAEAANLNLQSGYRSYNFQVSLYNSYVRRDGQAQADTYSARPGYSEHQTGFAADLGGTSNPSCNVAACYGQTPEGQWLAAHAHEYGYIIRYQPGKEGITGYQAEPWHIRYVGVATATDMRARAIVTLEEFFGLPAAPTYR